MHEYDTVLKALLEGEANSVLEQICGTRVARWLPIELPKVENLRIDLLGETVLGTLVHIEMQSTNDVDMAIRMAEYVLRILRLYKRFPRCIVLYVGEPPMRMATELVGPNLKFEFEAIDIRQLDAEQLLASPSLSDNVIAILAGLKNRKETVRRVLKRISQLSGEARGVAFQQLSILAGLRRLGTEVREEAKHMPILSDIMDHDLFGPVIRQGLEQGRQEGREQGRLEGFRTVIRHQIEKRFGPLSSSLEKTLTDLTEPELETVALRLLDANTSDELFPKP